MLRGRVGRGAFPPGDDLKLVALATSLPQDHGLAFTRWSGDELAARIVNEASDRRMSRSTVMRHLHELAERTGALGRFLIFGSYVSSTAEPRPTLSSTAPRHCASTSADSRPREAAARDLSIKSFSSSGTGFVAIPS